MNNTSVSNISTFTEYTDKATEAIFPDGKGLGSNLSPEAISARIKNLEKELETERMRLAACGVAALGNTPDTVKERITSDNPYYSASYSDVCAAVDREIRYREMLKQECDDIDSVITHLGWEPNKFRTEGGSLQVGKLKSALSDVVRPGSGG